MFGVKNRFDLEQEILGCWYITSDLDVLLQAIDREASDDEIMNIIIGLKALYDQKFQTLFNTFNGMVHKQTII